MNTRVEISDSTLGNIVHKIISYFRSQMAESWEKEIQKADYWMMDETPALVGCVKDGVKSFFKRYFWEIKAKTLKLAWFLYENGSRGIKAIKPYLDEFIAFFTTDGYVVYKIYKKKNHSKNPVRLSYPYQKILCGGIGRKLGMGHVVY